MLKKYIINTGTAAVEFDDGRPHASMLSGWTIMGAQVCSARGKAFGKGLLDGPLLLLCCCLAIDCFLQP